MIIIPGFVIALLTFPGVIVHEAAHLLFCKLRRVPVFDVCFFRVGGNPSGFVVHETPKDFLSTLLICVGPLIVNTVLCIVFCFPAFAPVRIFQQEDFLLYALLWLGVSIGMHAFPSMQDGKILWTQAIAAAKQFNLLAIISLPIVCLIFIANIGSFFWLDYLYGIAIGILLPDLIFKQMF
jgi:hypothetical protein